MAFHASKLVWPWRHSDAPLLRESNQNLMSATPTPLIKVFMIPFLSCVRVNS